MANKPDNRDVRKSHTPPAGVRAQTAPEAFPDEETPALDGDPVSQLTTRARQATNASREAASSSKAAFAMIREVRQEVRAYSERDEADHDRLFASYDRLDKKVDDANAKIDRTNDIVADVRETFGTALGEISGKLSTLTGVLYEERRERFESAQMRAELEAEVEVHEKVALVEVKKHEKLSEIQERTQTAEFARQKQLKVLGYIGSFIALLGTIAAFIFKYVV